MRAQRLVKNAGSFQEAMMSIANWPFVRQIIEWFSRNKAMGEMNKPENMAKLQGLAKANQAVNIGGSITRGLTRVNPVLGLPGVKGLTDNAISRGQDWAKQQIAQKAPEQFRGAATKLMPKDLLNTQTQRDFLYKNRDAMWDSTQKGMRDFLTPKPQVTTPNTAAQ